MPYLLVLERASGTHKHSVQQALGLLTSTCSVVCLFPQVHSNKLRLAALEVPGFIFLWCLGAQRKGMVISIERRILIYDLLSRLSKKQREIIVLEYFYGYKDREIGNKLNVSRQAVNKQKNSALKKLRLFMAS